jgi:O-antigen ligase
MTPRRITALRPAFAAAFVAAAMILGGGGSPNPATEILLQLLWAVVAIAWLWLPGSARLSGERVPWAIAALALLVPCLQLVPLPPALWHAVPGQEDRVAALALVGGADRWQPLTLSPSRTLAGLLALLPPVWLFLLTAGLDLRGRDWLLRTIVAVGLAAVLLGTLQVSLGAGAPRIYPASNTTLTGFQANKNAAADVFLIALVAAGLALATALRPAHRDGSPLRPGGARAAWLGFGGIALALLTATALTQSRAGILLAPVALAGAWVILSPALGLAGGRRWLPVAGVAAALLAGFAAVRFNAALGASFARFAAEDDFRRELWRDAWFALDRNWPFGLGLGGAANALIAAERLEVVDPSVPNRVHNDYLEFMLEGGMPALAIVAAIAVLLVWAARRRWRESPKARGHTVCGLTVLAIVALHSLVDYPLRSMALACLTGVGAGLLFAPSATQTRLRGRIQEGSA